MNIEDFKTDSYLLQEYQVRVKLINKMINAYGEEGVELCINESCIRNLFVCSSDFKVLEDLFQSIEEVTVCYKAKKFKEVSEYMDQEEFETEYARRLYNYSFVSPEGIQFIIKGKELFEV